MLIPCYWQPHDDDIDTGPPQQASLAPGSQQVACTLVVQQLAASATVARGMRAMRGAPAVTGAITIGTLLPAGVSAPRGTIPAGQLSVTIQLSAAGNARVGTDASVHAVGRGGQHSATSDAFSVVVRKK